MKRLILIIVIFMASCLVLSEHDAPPLVDQYIIGRFIVYQSERGFQASDMTNISGYHRRAINAIKQIQ